MSADHISIAEARRIALAAQGFDRPRPSRKINASDISRTIRRLALLQIDYVNVLIPAQYMVLFSRLGPYRRDLLDTVVYRKREFTEHWAHVASIVPMSTWPLLAYRRETHRVWPFGFETFLEQHPRFVEQVLEEVRARGPLTGGDLEHPEGTERRMRESWFGSTPRAVLEAHFGHGRLAIADRRPDFGRVYDLVERVIPPEYRSVTVAHDDARRELLRQAARAHGVATAADLADYFRMGVPQARPRIAELVEMGELIPVKVEGWRETAYLYKDAKSPRRIDATALLAPFDPVVWFRKRAARLFHFDYRFEIFVPAEKRKWGCYVLPFLMAERLVARVDLKSDRENRRLLVLAVHLEPDHHEVTGGDAALADALARELHVLAGWLDFESVSVTARTRFARQLANVSHAL